MAVSPDYTGSGAGFLTDYSGLAGAGAAFQGFAGAFQDAQDRKMKQQEMLAKIKANQIQMQRDQDETTLKAQAQGLIKNPDTGQFDEAPLSPNQRTSMNLKAIQGGARDSGMTDTAGNPIYEPNPDYWRAAQAQGMLNMRQQSLNNQGQRLQIQGQRFDEQQNQNAIAAGKNINEDPSLRDMVDARNALSRGKNLLNGSTPLTYNNLNAVQQDVINGMTKGGQSSEGKVSREMQESWIGNWNNLMSKAGQYGENNDIRKQDPGLATQIGALLSDVDGTIGQNQQARYQQLAKGYGASTNKKVQQTVQAVGQGYTPQPQGLVQPGLVKPGLVGKPQTQQDAPPPAQAHPMASAAQQWATATLNNAKSSDADKQKAQMIMQRLGQ